MTELDGDRWSVTCDTLGGTPPPPVIHREGRNVVVVGEGGGGGSKFILCYSNCLNSHKSVESCPVG